MLEFSAFSLDAAILQQVTELGYGRPTPIQAQGIPPVLQGRDLLGIAKTGSGKTAAFALPIIERLNQRPETVSSRGTRSLILSPTRELAGQIEQSFKNYGQGLNLKSAVVYGGVGKQPQIDALELGLDILVATPGRLLDLYQRGHIDFSNLEFFVLDEADMMLDMGFLNDVKKVIDLLPDEKQTLLFSATMPEAIEKLSENLLIDPIRVEVDSSSTVVESIEQKIYTLEKCNKPYLLNSLLENPEFRSVLLFCKTKFGADRIIEGLERTPIACAAIHSGKTQAVREQALKSFKEGKIRVLVATDIAARGIDIDNVSHVINFNLPEDPKSYIHRIGRTGRAGKSGIAISFCVESEVALLKSIGKLTKQFFSVDSEQPFHKEISFSFRASMKNKKKKKASKKRR
ncbi:MAG: DEAD/DEAH box helicase [Halobacteriovoraceae bacterium]|nr:DEAD/DEAH box helicase [Halobacteriovoraceae bacterium]MBT5092623.1 DEAD/DEAH box helicase [Halobacteriovoraceae bacterium]